MIDTFGGLFLIPTGKLSTTTRFCFLADKGQIFKKKKIVFVSLLIRTDFQEEKSRVCLLSNKDRFSGKVLLE